MAQRACVMLQVPACLAAMKGRRIDMSMNDHGHSQHVSLHTWHHSIANSSMQFQSSARCALSTACCSHSIVCLFVPKLCTKRCSNRSTVGKHTTYNTYIQCQLKTLQQSCLVRNWYCSWLMCLLLALTSRCVARNSVLSCQPMVMSAMR